MTTADDLRNEVLDLVQRMNDCWVKGHPEQLSLFFREDIVMVRPDFTHRTEGRAACVASYADFCGQATIRGFVLGAPSIDVFSNTAVATYSYRITYEMGGELFSDEGRDVYVFARVDDRWQAARRTMIIPQAESVN